jgi:hypothetical protein
LLKKKFGLAELKQIASQNAKLPFLKTKCIEHAKIVRIFLFINVPKVFMIKIIPTEGVISMRKLNAFTITLLLTYLGFTFLHISSTPTRPHLESKAIVLLDDWNGQTQWDNGDSSPDLQSLIMLSFALLTGALFKINLPRILDKKFIFLIPIFHQSNYVILLPKL